MPLPELLSMDDRELDVLDCLGDDTLARDVALLPAHACNPKRDEGGLAVNQLILAGLALVVACMLALALVGSAAVSVVLLLAVASAGVGWLLGGAR